MSKNCHILYDAEEHGPKGFLGSGVEALSPVPYLDHDAHISWMEGKIGGEESPAVMKQREHLCQVPGF